MEVKVLKKHLRDGLKKSFTHHAVCLAIRDAVKQQHGIPDFKSLIIPFLGYAWLNGAVWELPLPVLEYIVAVDNGTEKEEAVFEIEDFPPDGFFEWKINRRKPKDGCPA